MKKYSKVLAVVITVLMLVTVAAGCGSGSSNVEEKSTQAAQVTSSTAQSTVKEELKPVTLRFYFPGDKKAETDNVWKEVGKKVKDKLNADFEINYVSWTDFPTKMTLIAASGDKYDMNFDANWTGLYTKMINANSYLPLNDLLPKYAPKIYETLKSAGSLGAVTVNGNVMSIPWTMAQNQARVFMVWRADIAQKYGLNYAKDSIKTIEDLNKFLLEAKKVLPKDVAPFEWNMGNTNPALGILMAKNELVNLDFHSFTFDLNDPTCKLIPIEQTQAYKESVAIAKQWVDDGIISKNLIVSKGDVNSDFRNGKVLMTLSTHEWANCNWGFTDPNAKIESSEMYTDKKSYNRSPLANVNALNRSAANPERTLMFLDMVQSNKELYDLVMYGIEGKTYVLDGEKAAYPQGMTAQNSNYMEWHGQWGMWSPEFMRPTDQYPAGFWKAESDFATKNSLNVPNKIIGLFFNTDSIKNEIAKRDTLDVNVGKLLQYGVSEDIDKELASFIDQQKAAGLDKILAELQKQVDTYLAGSK